MAQAVQQEQFGAATEQELDLFVVVIVYALHTSAEGFLEGNAPDSLAVFIVQANGAVRILIQVIGLARGIIHYREQPRGDYHNGIPFQHLHLGALKGTCIYTQTEGRPLSGQIQRCRGRSEPRAADKVLQRRGQVGRKKLCGHLRSVREGSVTHKTFRKVYRGV